MEKITKTAKEVNDDIDYLFSKINWAKSNLDAKAIRIMNDLTNTINELSDGKECSDELPASNCIKHAVIKSVCPRCGGKLINTEQYGLFCPDIACRVKGQTVL